LALEANCGNEMDIRRVIVTALSKCGRIDAFFCNAGIPCNGGVDVPNEEWTRIWNVNVMQITYVARHLFPRWQSDRQKGFMCVTASAAGLLTQVGSMPYSVTKHAAVSAAEWLRITYQDAGIHVTCVCPQAVQTGMLAPRPPSGVNVSGGPAGGDGVLEPVAVAQMTIDAMAEGKFIVLPHPAVHKYFQRKAADYDRWVAGMGKVQRIFGEVIATSPNLSAAKL
jgi:NAD(P)-dependent dehydrogenase (short-subunit alcohol dehydrogenase family)